MTPSRRGASLVEAIVALVLGAFVVHLGLATLLEVDRRVAESSVRTDASLAARIVRVVLRAEFNGADPSVDWSVGPDTIALRVFRGVGVVCPGTVADSTVRVAYRGGRDPDPARDSLEVRGTVGPAIRLALTATRNSSAPCSIRRAGETVQEWAVDGAFPSGAVVVRPFERGSYHLTGGALRYRAAGGGRQPLTPEVFVDGGSGFEFSGPLARVVLAPVVGRRWAGPVGRLDAR